MNKKLVMPKVSRTILCIVILIMSDIEKNNKKINNLYIRNNLLLQMVLSLKIKYFNPLNSLNKVSRIHKEIEVHIMERIQTF